MQTALYLNTCWNTSFLPSSRIEFLAVIAFELFFVHMIELALSCTSKFSAAEVLQATDFFRLVSWDLFLLQQREFYNFFATTFYIIPAIHINLQLHLPYTTFNYL